MRFTGRSWLNFSDYRLVKDKTVRVETNVYAVKPPDGELIWTGTSNTFNPSSAHKVIKPLVNLVVKQLEQEAILPSQRSNKTEDRQTREIRPEIEWSRIYGELPLHPS
jgi:hypothetical protein